MFYKHLLCCKTPKERKKMILYDLSCNKKRKIKKMKDINKMFKINKYYVSF